MVLVMGVGVVPVTVSDCFVDMSVPVAGADRYRWLVGVLVMAVLGRVPVAVLDGLMGVDVVVPFGQVQPNTDAHERRDCCRSGGYLSWWFASSSSRIMPTDVAHASPRQASMPSLIAKAAMTSPAIASAHHQPNNVLSNSPARTAADR